MRIMNYLKSLVLCLLAVSFASMTAANVDSRAAQARAIQFLNSQSRTRFMASSANLKLAHAEASAVDAKCCDFYVFNYDGGGYVIVAGDDRAEAILGYGDGTLDMNRIPANMKWWLDQYKQQIEFLIDNPKLKVQRLSESSAMLKASTVVQPLLSCEWDQMSPYWNQCPSYGGSTCLTGCVATAMAQVMYYWKYPAQLPALPKYTTRTRRISVAALPGTTLDWNSMTDTYSNSSSSASKTAVATLMRYCGQAVEMDYDNYNNGGSGAYSDDQLEGMKLFGYNSGATYLQRSSYSDANWTSMMLEDLQAQRPILYGGDDGTYGHAFVVDGYDGSKFHINWGWSGEDNGYFAISSFMIDSDYDFRKNQDMLYQIYPEGTAIETYAPVMADAGNVSTTSFKASWTDQTLSENVQDYTLYVQAYDPNSMSLLTETFAGVTASNDGSARIESSLDTYCDNAGWTGSYVYQAGGGGLKFGNSSNGGYLTTPALDLSTCGGVITVKFSAKNYGSDATTLTISCGNVSQTVSLTSSAADYAVVLNGVNAAAGQQVTLASTGSKQRWYLYQVEIVTGYDSRSMLRATETGDASSRVITGITGKNYTVTGLNQGGSYRFYVEANYTDGSKRQSNVKTVTLDGNAEPVPEVIVDPESLTLTAMVGETATATFDVLAADLKGDVTLTLNDANGVFSVNPAAISMADAQEGATVTVTYAPTATGAHNATVTLSSEGASDVVVTLNGTAAMTTVAPVMAAATQVGTTSFTASWTDETQARYVTDYTLYVNRVGAAGTALLSETFAGVTADNDGTAHIESALDEYCDNAGWTGSYVYQAGGGGLKLGNSSNGGYLTSPALDLTNCGGSITVTINAKNYGSDATTLTISCGDASQTVSLTGAAADHTVTLTGVNAAAGQQVTIASSGSKQRWYLYSVNIYNGVSNALRATETGDAEGRVITGITGKTYTVAGLTPGATYNFHVVANYVDGNNASSNTEQVTLVNAVVPELIVDNETVTMAAAVGETAMATFGVLAANLTGNVTVTLNDVNGVYSIEPTTITVADAQEGATVTVTYAPVAAGTHDATITLSSVGAEDVTVTLSGTATMETLAPEMQPADEEYVTTTSFRADWVDVTPERYVASYTLYVNKKQQVPAGATLLTETFYSEDVPTSDSNYDEGANGTLDDCCDNDGWTGYAVYLAANGGLKLGAGTKVGSLTTPALDLTNCGGTVTVKFNARSYGNDGSSIIVSCGEVADTIELTAEPADYTVVLNGVTAAADQHVTFSCTAVKKRINLYSVTVIGGAEVAARTVTEVGDADSRVIEGITDQYYVVENLTPGATYEYYVKAIYIDDTQATSNVETVTLLEESAHGYKTGDVNHDNAVDIDDVTALISIVLGGGTAQQGCPICANVDGQGSIDIDDVTVLIAIVLGTNN